MDYPRLEFNTLRDYLFAKNDPIHLSHAAQIIANLCVIFTDIVCDEIFDKLLEYADSNTEEDVDISEITSWCKDINKEFYRLVNEYNKVGLKNGYDYDEDEEETNYE